MILNYFKQQRLKYPKTPIISHLNIYSLRNKLIDFKKLILNETDVFLISEMPQLTTEERMLTVENISKKKVSIMFNTSSVYNLITRLPVKGSSNVTW